MTGMPGWSEMLVILFIVLLLFGAKKLPELAKALGKSISEFKKGKDEVVNTVESDPAKAEKKPEAQDNNQQKSA